MPHFVGQIHHQRLRWNISPRRRDLRLRIAGEMISKRPASTGAVIPDLSFGTPFARAIMIGCDPFKSRPRTSFSIGSDIRK